MKLVFYIFEIILLFFSAYLFYPFLFFPFFYKRIKSQISNTSNDLAGTLKSFYIIIPAHNEEKYIGKLLQSIKEQDYPQELINVIVIADNCNDRTTEIVRSFEYDFFEKNDRINSGKAGALSFATEKLKSYSDLDSKCIIVVDSDCLLDSKFCKAMDYYFQKRPSNTIFQGFRYVDNSNVSSVSGLDAGAEAIRQWINLGVRHCLGLNVRMHGSGMAFHANDFIDTIKLAQGTIVEDKQWNAYLLLMSKKICWAPSAHLAYYSSENNDNFSKQRKRWIGGQYEVAQKVGMRLLFNGLVKFDINKLDFALSLFLPPRSVLLFALIMLLLVNIIFNVSLLTSEFLLLFIILALLFYGFIGIKLSGTKISFYNLIIKGIQLVLTNVFTSLMLIFSGKQKKWGKSR